MSQEHLINECKRLQEDALYTAETHFIIAAHLKKVGFWTKLVPAVSTAISGSVASFSNIDAFSWVTVFAAIATALGVVYDPERTYNEHSSAAKDFTVLKQRARYYYETYVHEVTREDFFKSVNDLRERYNELIYSTPQTQERYFRIAQKRIKSGKHLADYL